MYVYIYKYIHVYIYIMYTCELIYMKKLLCLHRCCRGMLMCMMSIRKRSLKQTPSPSNAWICVAVRYEATWKREFKLEWREAGPSNHLDEKVDGCR